MRLNLLATSCLVLSLLSAAPVSAQTPFRPKAGDLWVMSGDSITAQRLHSNYIEAFYRTRYPELNLQFRNSGVGGNTVTSLGARFDYDIAAFKPTIVSIELGMNDVGRGDDPKGYLEGMKKLLEKVRAMNATPLLISSSPVNDGSAMDDWKSDRCRRIHPYTEALVKLAAEEKVAVVDQYHPLLAMWRANRTEDGAQKTSLGGDPVHPAHVGQYTMAAVILDKLGVDREVSSATLKADGTLVEAKGCKISDASSSDGVLRFTRLDERGPWPIPTASRTALNIMPEIVDLSRYLLTVTGLPAGDYTVLTNGAETATVSAADLAKGWNMTALEKGAVAERNKKILDLITLLQGKLNTEWRSASKAQDAAKLAEVQAQITATETELAAACKPTAVQFELRPAKP
jgi:lysophospholipase L1-like esterase